MESIAGAPYGRPKPSSNPLKPLAEGKIPPPRGGLLIGVVLMVLEVILVFLGVVLVVLEVVLGGP